MNSTDLVPGAILRIRPGTSPRPRSRTRSSPPPNRRRSWKTLEDIIGLCQLSIGPGLLGEKRKRYLSDMPPTKIFVHLC